MKTALVTMAMTPSRLRMGKTITFPRMAAYAARYDMHFIILDRPRRDPATGDIWDWERADALYDLLGKYDRILHLEDDVIVRKDAQDVRPLPAGTFYGFDNAPYNPAEVLRCWQQARQTWPELAAVHGPMQHLYNNGMFLVDRSQRQLFAPASCEPLNDNSIKSAPSHWKGMGLMNARLHALNLPSEHRPDIFGVSYQWLTADPPGQDRARPPDFLHVLWYGGPKVQGVREFARWMDA